MTPDEIARLASLGSALRPNWPEASLRTFITDNLRHRSYGDLAVALAWVAAKELDQETPKALLKSGPWWEACNADGHTTRRPPKPHEECGTHPGEYRLGCRLHAADLKARRDEAAAASGRLTREQAIAAMRDNLATAQHRLDVALNRNEETA